MTMFWTPNPGSEWGVCGQNICYHAALWFHLIGYANWPCSEKVGLWPFYLNPRVGGGSAKYMLPCYNLLCNMTMSWKFWILTFYLTPGSRGAGWGSAGNILATVFLYSWFPLIWYATRPSSDFFKFWPPHQGSEGGCGQSICDHIAAFVIPFNLICNMTLFWSSLMLTFWPQPRVEEGWGLWAKYLIPCYCIRDSLWFDV